MIALQNLARECRKEAHFQLVFPRRVLLQEEEDILLGIAGAVQQGKGTAVWRSLHEKKIHFVRWALLPLGSCID